MSCGSQILGTSVKPTLLHLQSGCFFVPVSKQDDADWFPLVFLLLSTAGLCEKARSQKGPCVCVCVCAHVRVRAKVKGCPTVTSTTSAPLRKKENSALPELEVVLIYTSCHGCEKTHVRFFTSVTSAGVKVANHCCPQNGPMTGLTNGLVSHDREHAAACRGGGRFRSALRWDSWSRIRTDTENMFCSYKWEKVYPNSV